MKQHNQGFTLIELITVLILISVIAAYATMRTPSSATYNLTSVAEQLRRDIRLTQTLATSLNTTYTITLLADSYSISPTPPTGAVAVTMPSGVTLTPTTLSFNSMGAPSGAASITVTATGAPSITITVAAETGFING
jgi:prepilin-type N-terminal cleavage/methylation domain-containing protein